MTRMRRDRRGQAAMVDAILFLTIMLMASAVIIGASGWSGVSGTEFSGLQQYTSDYASTLFSLELNHLHYTGSAGQYISGGDSGISVSQALCDEVIIMLNNGGDNFTDYENSILAAGRNLLRPGLDFAVSCNNGMIFISARIGNESELPPNRCAGRMDVAIENSVNASLTVYVWVV